MEWNKYTIKTLATAEDAISGMLLELGIYGIEIEDNVPLSEEDKKAMYIDIVPVLPENDNTAYISFYLEESEEEKQLVQSVKEALTKLSGFVEIGEGQIISSVSREEDWINNWKEFFKPFVVDNIIIKPTWECLDENNIIDIAKNDKTDREALSTENDDKIVIEIDPGTAFGTGRHETTRLCIGQILKYVKPGMNVLDAGCGSGILSIVAAKVGATEIKGTDIDKIAVDSAKENLIQNGIKEESFSMLLGNLIEDEALRKEVGFECFDVVVANILADVIIPMSKVIPMHLKPNGIFISSGIINTKEEDVKAAILANGMEIVDVIHLNDWVSVVAKKPN